MKKWLAVQAAAVMLGMTLIQTVGGLNEVHADEVVQQQATTVSAGVERQSDGTIKLSWELGAAQNGDVRITWSRSPYNFDKEHNVLTSGVKENSFVVKDPNPSGRTYFLIEGGGTSVITAERKVNVKGLDNFRDLGGYRTADGRTIKWGKLFRANELAALTTSDKQVVQDLGIRTDIDFRSQGEVAQKPDPQIPGVTYVWDPVMKDLGNSTDITQLFKMDYASMMAMMEDGQRNMVSDPQVQAYKTMFELLKDPANGAIVYHCTAGKDRTGLGSALILLALGVDEKTIMQDYLLSNDYRAAGNQATLKYMAPMMTTEDSKKIATSILGVEPEWLQASLDEIKKQYGTYDVFFEKVLGVTAKDREELKTMYLETPGTYAPSFGDIMGHWAQKDIEQLTSESIVSGVNDLAFAPNRSITRAEFAALLVRGLKLPASAAPSGFQDVADSDWYAAPVSAAVKAKLISGYEDHSFKPDAPITREELSAMLVRAMQASGTSTALSADAEKSVLAKFKDSSSIVWARPEMAAALQSGLVNGLGDDMLSPSVPATRAQAATMLERFLQLAKKA
ncbi:hypothetical protein A8709_18520 [Paenibacillus pectinilyticus]|uniref:Protein tyrosine phosphatase n=1 Tax=Paenibacillus pectinilyticus TaxID=512399 RepID=A0A1C0ZZN8_9BACL|nr:tyrosine-protein phosphatase [Paenibacillus pectinilyticus]OCT13588.1 hypothetical protein A8709_18520 [Paenibacillus pectinilyticus]